MAGFARNRRPESSGICTLPGFTPTPQEIFEDVTTGIDLIDKLDDEGLKKRISDKSYFRNFRALVREMAPDEQKISFVGLKTMNKSFGLTKPKKDIPAVPQEEKIEESKKVHVTGVLDYARSRRDDVIGLTDVMGNSHYIRILEGMDDVVRSHFKDTVKVTGELKGKHIFPEEIEPIED